MVCCVLIVHVCIKVCYTVVYVTESVDLFGQASSPMYRKYQNACKLKSSKRKRIAVAAENTHKYDDSYSIALYMWVIRFGRMCVCM